MKTMNHWPLTLVVAALVPLASSQLGAQVTSDRIVRAAEEPRNWLTYNGTYSSQRYSRLDQITPANINDLQVKWMLQNQVFGAWQTSPIVDNGIMYISKKCFSEGTKRVAVALLEEYTHCKHEVFDETPEQKWVYLEQIISLGERIHGEPL